MRRPQLPAGFQNSYDPTKYVTQQPHEACEEADEQHDSCQKSPRRAGKFVEMIVYLRSHVLASSRSKAFRASSSRLSFCASRLRTMRISSNDPGKRIRMDKGPRNR